MWKKEEDQEELGKRIVMVPVAVLFSQNRDHIFSQSFHVHHCGSRAIGTDLAVVDVHGKSLGKNSGYVP